MMWKPYVVSVVVFAIVYVLTSGDPLASYGNGFVAFYLMYKHEQKSERTVANMEVGA